MLYLGYFTNVSELGKICYIWKIDNSEFGYWYILQE